MKALSKLSFTQRKRPRRETETETGDQNRKKTKTKTKTETAVASLWPLLRSFVFAPSFGDGSRMRRASGYVEAWAYERDADMDVGALHGGVS